MGYGYINIWIRNENCKPIDEDGIINIKTCDGMPFKWCNHYFGNIPFHCGHVKINIPPGCYIVQARTEERVYTHKAMVIISCNDYTCVNLIRDPHIREDW